jgi:hypothetical protein
MLSPFSRSFFGLKFLEDCRFSGISPPVIYVVWFGFIFSRGIPSPDTTYSPKCLGRCLDIYEFAFGFIHLELAKPKASGCTLCMIKL